MTLLWHFLFVLFLISRSLQKNQDVFGEGRTSQLCGTKMASTKYFRFNPIVGEPNAFPIDEIDPKRLQELCDIVDRYMAEDEQQLKLKQLGEVIHPKSRLQRVLESVTHI